MNNLIYGYGIFSWVRLATIVSYSLNIPLNVTITCWLVFFVFSPIGVVLQLTTILSNLSLQRSLSSLTSLSGCLESICHNEFSHGSWCLSGFVRFCPPDWWITDLAPWLLSDWLVEYHLVHTFFYSVVRTQSHEILHRVDNFVESIFGLLGIADFRCSSKFMQFSPIVHIRHIREINLDTSVPTTTGNVVKDNADSNNLLKV